MKRIDKRHDRGMGSRFCYYVLGYELILQVMVAMVCLVVLVAVVVSLMVVVAVSLYQTICFECGGGSSDDGGGGRRDGIVVYVCRTSK